MLMTLTRRGSSLLLEKRPSCESGGASVRDATSTTTAGEDPRSPTGEATTSLPLGPLTEVVGSILEDILSSSAEPEPNSASKPRSKFHCRSAPSISIKDYMKRIAKYAKCSTECYVLSLIYLDTLQSGFDAYRIHSMNVHRLILASLLVAIKFHDDKFFDNKFYAKIAGISVEELNMLELDVLKALDFRLYVDSIQYGRYTDEIIRNMTATTPTLTPTSLGSMKSL